MGSGWKNSILLALFVAMHGCTLSCSYSSDAKFVTTGKQPKLLWKWEVVGEERLSGAGCVTNAARIFCTVTRERRSSLISWDTTDNGQTPWNVSFSRTVALPIIDLGGDVLASDGSKLVGYQGNGTPFGKAIRLFPINGQLFDLITLNSEIVLLYKCGFLVTYLTNGIPDASIWLNDTVDGESGTFIPLGNPAAKGVRFFVLTAFRAHSEKSNNISTRKDLKLRMYAIELRDDAVVRIYIAWHYDFTMPDVTLPYLNSSETLCTVEPSKEQESDQSREPLVHITTDDHSDHFTVVFNYREPTVDCTKKDCQQGTSNVSRMMIFEDLGESTRLVLSQEFTNPFQALAYNTSGAFWTVIFDVDSRQSFLQQYSFQSGSKMSNINITKLLSLESKQFNITSELTFLYTSGASHPLVFCALVENTESLLIAVDASDQMLLWTVEMDSEACVGQITSVDGAKDSFLIVTTLSHMFVYSLT